MTIKRTSGIRENDMEHPFSVRDPFQSVPNDHDAEVNQEMPTSFGGAAVNRESITSSEPDVSQYTAASVLSRGLQVPSRTRYVSSGFAFPVILEQAGVSKQMWTEFTKEVSSHASLSRGQWLTAIGGGAGIGFVSLWAFGPLGLLPAAFVGHKVRDEKEHLNFAAAKQNGAIVECLKRWNDSYFSPKGFSIRIDLPGEAEDMDAMDISTSKLSKQSHSGHMESQGPLLAKIDSRLLRRDVKARRKATTKGRIVIIPLKTVPAGAELQRSRPMVGDGTDDDNNADTLSVAATDEVTLNEESYRRRDMYPHEPKP
ncbi:MAG: hypothetical protein FRX48_03414 [Lasallia pustulata]|uniref:Uncharacterized protein n=1 Tax=Lasallia pustulata TaxID=136370 RepID=A0A5M8PSL9_9LECA|nr:MAG: hypothetical protein FRX48_03414 [Lasallia pustulata]